MSQIICIIIRWTNLNQIMPFWQYLGFEMY